MKSVPRFCLFLVLLAASVCTASRAPGLPERGVIPDEKTAVAVGEAILRPVFGDEEVARFSLYHAQIQAGMWTVYGTLPSGSHGGTPMIRLRKSDAKVVEIWHSQ